MELLKLGEEISEGSSRTSPLFIGDFYLSNLPVMFVFNSSSNSEISSQVAVILLVVFTSGQVLN